MAGSFKFDFIDKPQVALNFFGQNFVEFSTDD
jgi:hypothetical protein